MGFDDLIGDDDRRHRDQRGYRYADHHGHNHHDNRDDERYPYRSPNDELEDSRYSRHRHDHRGGDFDLEHIARLVLANKKLVIAAALVLVVVIVLAAIFLLPLLGQVLGYVDKGGVKGVLDIAGQLTKEGK